MEPFIKWAGGKRWLVKSHSILFPSKGEFNKYLEPFVGGGSVFFHLEPAKAIINDINKELITTYLEIQSNWENLEKRLRILNKLHSCELFYKIRSQTPKNSEDTAVRFLYLNRTCWNGLYRVNKNNSFNVPIGTKSNLILATDNFCNASRVLKQTQIFSEDFEMIISKSRKNDFLFIDPPYTVKHNLNGFIKYNEKLFTWDDQIRLHNVVVRAVSRGVKVLILNADHESIRDLYKGVGDQYSLSRASVISGKKENRGTYTELAIKCF